MDFLNVYQLSWWSGKVKLLAVYGPLSLETRCCKFCTENVTKREGDQDWMQWSLSFWYSNMLSRLGGKMHSDACSHLCPHWVLFIYNAGGILNFCKDQDNQKDKFEFLLKVLTKNVIKCFLELLVSPDRQGIIQKKSTSGSWMLSLKIFDKKCPFSKNSVFLGISG